MADRSSERDRRVRQLLGNKNPGFDVMGQAQAEIQDAQSDLYNHIAMQQMQSQARLQENAMISQMAGGMLAMEGGNQLQAQAAQMNPATQATLSKYGVRPSQSQNTSRNSQSQRIITKSGDTTNIRNENITNNRTDIRVTQPPIPMQQPVIVSGGGGSKGESNTAKFKAWLSGMFARQQNEAEIQKKEYRKKEWALGRTTSKLMKKIGESTANLGNRLDPKNMANSIGGQLKWLLLLFGATMIGKVWKPAMSFLANLEGGFRAAFGLPLNEDLRSNASKGLSIVDKLKEAIGIKSGEKTTLLEGIKLVFFEGINKLIDKLQFWFEDRAGAIKGISFPEIGKIDYGLLGDVFGTAVQGIVNSLKGVGQYLGDLMTVAWGGSKGKVKIEANKVQRKATDQLKSTSGKEKSAGDSALLTGHGRNYMRDEDYDTLGNLKGNASSTQAMSRTLISLFNDKSGTSHTAEIATGVSQLFNTAKREGSVVIDPELLSYLGVSQQDQLKLKRNGNLVQKPYRIITVNPSEAQKDEMGRYTGGYATGIGLAAGILTLDPVTTALSTVTGAATDATLTKATTKKSPYYKLVPADSSEKSLDGSLGSTKMLWVLDEEGVKEVKAQITSEMSGKNKDIDLTNQEFVSLIKKKQENVARQNGVVLSGESIGLNDLNVSWANLNAHERERYDRFESTDPNSWNQRNYGHYNAATTSVSNVINGALSWGADVIRDGAGLISASGIGEYQQNQRAAWLMKRAMEYGFTKEQASAIAGIAMRESGMKTEIAYTANDAGHGPGGGLVGWLGDNCKQVLRYAKDQYGCNVNPNNVEDIKKVPFETQADILLRLLTGGLDYNSGIGKKAGDKIKATTTISDATYAMDRFFQITSDEAMRVKPELVSRRNDYASGFYQISLTTVDTSRPSLGSPISSSKDDGMMVGKSGSTTRTIKNWLWEGTAPTEYDPKDESRAISLMVTIQVPAHNFKGEEGILSLTVNRKLAEDVTSIFTEIFTQVPEFKIDQSTTGAYCFRKVNSKNPSNKLSNHSLGGAIDINWNINPLNDSKMENTDRHLGTKEHPVVQIFYRHGWIWGGSWSIRDTMHFEFDGEIGGGTVNDSSDVVGNIRNWASDALYKIADFIDPNSGGSGDVVFRTSDQEQAFNDLRGYNQYTNQVSVGALLRAGARVDNYGIYVQGQNGTNVYLNDQVTGLGGKITSSDVAFVGRINQETGALEGVTDEEIQIAKDSIQVTSASMFSSYEGKGSPSDRMVNKNGEAIKFYLGKFKDIDDFSDHAKKILNFHGGIKFWICPTKDASRINFIEISPVFSSNLAVGESKEEAEGKYGWKYVGPIIYELGRKWYNPFGDEKLTSDWSPTSIIHSVRLTPKAEEERLKLFKILSFGKLIEKDGKLYKSSDGTALTREEFEDAKKFGVISKTRYRVGSRHNTGPFANYGLSDDVSFAMTEAKAAISEGGKFQGENYFSDLGISFEDRERFFKENQGKFRYSSDGNIYGPGGTIWGTGTKDNYKLFGSISEFNAAQEKRGDKGLRENNIKNIRHLESLFSASQGTININAIGDYLNQIGTVDIYGKDSDLIEKIDRKRSVTGTAGRGKIGEYEFKYYMYNSISGDTRKYRVLKKDLLDFMRNIVGEDIINTKDVPDKIEAKSLDELTDKLINTASKIIANTRSGTENGFGFKVEGKYLDVLGVNDEKSFRRVLSSLDRRTPPFDKLKEHLVRKKKLISEDNNGIKFELNIEASKEDIVPPDMVTVKIKYQDGTEESITKGQMFFVKDDEKLFNKIEFIKSINSVIKKNSEDLGEAAAIKYFEGSSYQDNLNTIVDNAKEGDLDFKQDGMVVYKKSGVVVGTWDPKSGKKEVKKITGEDLEGNKELKTTIIEGQASDFFSTDAAKILFYQKYYGASLEDGKLWVYDSNHHFRTQIDLSQPIGQGSGADVFIEGSTQAKDKKGKWVDLKGIGYANYSETEGFEDTYTPWGSKFKGTGKDSALTFGFNRIVSSLGKVSDIVSLAAEYQKIIANNSTSQIGLEEESIRKATNQIFQTEKQTASILNQEDYLKIIANKAAGGKLFSESESTDIKDRIEQRDKDAITNAIFTSANTIGLSPKNLKFDTKMVTYKTQDGVFLVNPTTGETRRILRDENGDLRSHNIGATSVYDPSTKQITINWQSGNKSSFNVTETGSLVGVTGPDGTTPSNPS